MRRTLALCACMLGGFLLLSSAAEAGPLYLVTNELGYQGTVWNITDGTPPVQTADPITGERNADVFLVSDAPQIWVDSNILLSSWFSHTQSNQSHSFMQLYDFEHASEWSADGGWDATHTVFTATVTGSNASYATSQSRFWQPDTGSAPQVTFLDYAYSLTATFDTPALYDNGWLVSNGTLLSMIGSFSGTFLGSNGDTYGFNILLNSAWSTQPDYSFDGGDYSKFTEAAAAVPEPGTLTLLGLGFAGLARAVRKRAQRP